MNFLTSQPDHQVNNGEINLNYVDIELENAEERSTEISRPNLYTHFENFLNEDDADIQNHLPAVQTKTKPAENHPRY